MKRVYVRTPEVRIMKISPKLEDNKEILRQIMDAPNVGICVLKAVRDKKKKIIDFTFEYINRRTQEVFGTVNPVGTLLSSYGSAGTEQLEHFKEVIQTGKKNLYIHKLDSSIVNGWFLFSNASLVGDYLVQIWEDITELKKAEQELLLLKEEIAQKSANKYLVLFNAINQGVAHCKLIRDKHGNAQAIIVDEVNTVWEKIMGVKPKDVLGKNISEWLPNLDISWIEFCQRVMNTGHPESYEGRISDLGGRWYEVFLMPLGSEYFMALCTDTTSRRKAQEDLENAIALRDQFIGLASHELNTPVTSLKIYAQYLEQKFRKEKDNKKAVLLAKMVQQIDKLSLLISDLLDVTKIERGKLVFREEIFSFDSLLLETIEQVQRTSNSHKILRKGLARIKLAADRERIKQVLINLLSNAIKYSPKATRIIVSVQTSTRSLTVGVQDFGVGIAKNKQDKVFERFYREEGRDEITYPGLGIGLYVASEIIKRYHGKMWVKSSKGKGSTFYFSLPLRK